jgi:hypothetical protein
MEASRKTPSFYGKDQPLTLYLGGVFALLLGLCLFAGIVSPKNSFLDYSFGCLVGPFTVFLIIVGVVFMFHEGSSTHKDRISWFNTAVTAQTTIVKREIVDTDPEYASYYGHPDRYWHLQLEAIPDQLKVQPKTTSVLVSVSEYRYKWYEGRTSVTIYYSPVDPFVFLLEDEV